eukprot:TRINITY_DN27610_c0_g1_i1.p1 TRINITY_DN27610_c0_g1~~TRINITY_DN27610_c0_g1_i1.p1  ORF type:complete len:382 (-),score=122.29 TRINITY_DN27610_c0_g1_i1:11-1156(-)
MSHWVSLLSTELSTSKYYILHGGFLSNHLSQAVIALKELGAPDSQIEEVVKHQVAKQETNEGPTAKSQDANVVSHNGDMSKLLGQRKQYYALTSHYSNLLKNQHNGCLDSLVAGEFSKLYPGMVGSALHGLIHTGYGLSEGAPQLVCEGLAYLHHSYAPLVINNNDAEVQKKFGKGPLELTEVLNKVKADEELRKFMLEEVKKEWVVEKGLSRFQNLCLVLVAKKGDTLLSYANMTKAPATSGLGLVNWLLRCSVQLYSMAAVKNDFFLLHGATATWALSVILQKMKDNDQVIQICQAQLCILIAVYIARDSQALSTPTSDPPTQAIIMDRVLSLPTNTDEHVYKMVQICMAMMEENKQDMELHKLCLSACEIAINNKLII